MGYDPSRGVYFLLVKPEVYTEARGLWIVEYVPEEDGGYFESRVEEEAVRIIWERFRIHIPEKVLRQRRGRLEEVIQETLAAALASVEG